MNCVTSGRPSIRPISDPVEMIGGRGGDVAKVGWEPDEFICDVCSVDDEEELRATDEEEQAEKVKPLPTPFQPTSSQQLDHSITHYPYQSWCPHRVEGRGREFWHCVHVKELGAAPTTSFDYAFLSDGAEITSQEAFESVGESAIKVLIVRDDKSKAVFGQVVPQKGVDEKGFAVSSLVENVSWLGYSTLTFKSDNEATIVKLLIEALGEQRMDVVVWKADPGSYSLLLPAQHGGTFGLKLRHAQTARSSAEPA